MRASGRCRGWEIDEHLLEHDEFEDIHGTRVRKHAGWSTAEGKREDEEGNHFDNNCGCCLGRRCDVSG